MKRRQFTQSAIAALASAPLGHVFAQTGIKSATGFPDRPIKLIVPYPAGGVVDVVMRMVTEPLSNQLAERIVVENKTGADGRIGLDFVAKAPADGYTLLAATPLLSVGEHLMADMKGRVNDFVGLCAFAAPPSVYVVSSTLPVSSLNELVALAKTKPRELNVANPGSGSSNHLAQELFFDKAGIDLTNVNYKGQPPSLIDLAEGRIQFALISQNLALPMIKAGKIKPIAINANARTRSLPNVPTVSEAGFPDILVRPWYGAAAPAATPKPVVQFLNDQFQRTMADPAVRAKLEGLDSEIMALNSTQFDALIQSEFKRWGDLIRSRKISI